PGDGRSGGGEGGGARGPRAGSGIAVRAARPLRAGGRALPPGAAGGSGGGSPPRAGDRKALDTGRQAASGTTPEKQLLDFWGRLRPPDPSPRPAPRPPEQPRRGDVVEEAVGDRRADEGQEQRQRLAADDDRADGAVGGGAGAARDDERDHAGHEGHGGHEDGAQPIAVGRADGRRPRHSLGPQVDRVVDLQDAVFLDDAEEHEDAERREDVERLAEDDQRDEREGDGHRQRQEDGHRVEPALELRS